LLKITNKQYNNLCLTTNGNNIALAKKEETSTGWQLLEVCEMKQTAFKPHTIPCTIEVEDFDIGCPGDSYFDIDETNAGGKYRPNEGVDIEVCAAGGFNTGWAKSGEWFAYTVNVAKTGNYKMTIYVATVADSGKLHVEFDGKDKTGLIPVLNTGGYQNWKTVTKSVQLTAGIQVMKLVLDDANSGLNLDKVCFTIE